MPGSSGHPVVCSINGKGTVPEDHPLSVGAGYAVRAARDALEESATAVVLSGDVPLVSAETIEGLVEAQPHDLTLLLR